MDTITVTLIPCLCCRYLTLSERYGYEICPVCNWEDDPVQGDDPNFRGGANEVSLKEARANFARDRVSDLRFRKNVRDPLPEEMPVNSEG